MDKLPACFPVCTLDKFSADIAKEELNDDPKERESAIQTFRDWIKQQKWLKCPTGKSVLKIAEREKMCFFQNLNLVIDLIYSYINIAKMSDVSTTGEEYVTDPCYKQIHMC